MIEFKDVSKSFVDGRGRSVAAVRSLNLRVEDGEILCLVGTSGCGKTTTLRLVNRLIEATGGHIYVGSQEVRALDPIRLRRRIGYVIQTGGLFPHMTVAENVGLLGRVERWAERDVAERVDTLLRLVNLSPEAFRGRYPAELSGGQRQRVGVARALVLDPAYVLMDEPFGALDPMTKKDIHDEFLALQEKVQKTIVLVTHDMEEAFRLGSRVAIMHEGELLQVGTEDEFRTSPQTPFVRDFLSQHLVRRGSV